VLLELQVFGGRGGADEGGDAGRGGGEEESQVGLGGGEDAEVEVAAEVERGEAAVSQEREGEAFADGDVDAARESSRAKRGE
jgi:hypothetical protein